MSKETEKKVMAEKVAKVREVVQGVSNNDIILALHSYDLNVERTIQAFCEDGASGVLEDWVRPSGGSGKNKNRKKKKVTDSILTSANIPSVPAPSTASTCTSEVLKPEKVPSTQENVREVSTIDSKPRKAHTVNGFISRDKCDEVALPSQAKEHIQFTFKTLHSLISEREITLLNACHTNSSFDDRGVEQLIALINNFGIVCDGGGNSNNISPTPLPKAVSPVQIAAIRHATSQSSISSSVGADSGVNLSPTHKEEKKQLVKAVPAQVVSGGIKMASDALSSDQLAALQRSLEVQLAARGIDASVLSGVTAGDMPARRPRKLPESRKSGFGGHKEKNNRPQLSILNA